ncbi:MAG: hypothetical protein AAGD00_05070 [Planctomycetota bacterium]
MSRTARLSPAAYLATFLPAHMLVVPFLALLLALSLVPWTLFTLIPLVVGVAYAVLTLWVPALGLLIDQDVRWCCWWYVSGALCVVASFIAATDEFLFTMLALWPALGVVGVLLWIRLPRMLAIALLCLPLALPAIPLVFPAKYPDFRAANLDLTDINEVRKAPPRPIDDSLRRMTDEEIAALPLDDWLIDQDETVRWTALRAFSRIGFANAQSRELILQQALDRSNEHSTRSTALEAMIRIDRAWARETVLRFLRETAREDDSRGVELFERFMAEQIS